MKLGERLVKMGSLTREQLDEALRSQLIHGGHLGTCLLELQYVDEHLLGQVLSEVFHVPYATPDKLADVSQSVIDLLTPKIAEKHQAVPFDLEKMTLRIAIVNPIDLRALDEISFAAGKRLDPWVAPEARIFNAMERYYNIPRRPRYITISRDLDRPSVEPWQEPASPYSRDMRSTSASADPAGIVAAGATPEQPAIDPTPRVVASAPRAAEPSEPKPTGTKEILEDLEEKLTEALCSSETPEQLANAVLDYASQGLPRSMLFAVRSKTATLLHAKGLTVAPDRKANLRLSVTSDSPFKLLLGDDHYRGPVPADTPNQDFYRTLDTEIPSEILILPGYVDDRLEVLLYGDGGADGKIQGDTQDYRKLVRNLAIGLKLIYLKEMIRSR